MNDLAEAVGLSKPALYHYVRSKEELLVQLYEDVMRESLRSVRATAESDREAVDALREVLIERVAYTCENKRLLQIFFEEESELPKRQMATVRSARSEYEDIVLGLVERCVEAGALELQTSPRIFVNTALGAANWVYKWVQTARAAEAARPRRADGRCPAHGRGGRPAQLRAAVTIADAHKGTSSLGEIPGSSTSSRRSACAWSR